MSHKLVKKIIEREENREAYDCQFSLIIYKCVCTLKVRLSAHSPVHMIRNVMTVLSAVNSSANSRRSYVYVRLRAHSHWFVHSFGMERKRTRVCEAVLRSRRSSTK